MSGENPEAEDHPLLTTRAQGVIAVLALATGLGIALMSFHLLILGESVSIFGVLAAVWIYADQFRALQREMVVIIAVLLIALMAPAIIVTREMNTDGLAAPLQTSTTARLRVRFLANTPVPEVIQRANVLKPNSLQFTDSGLESSDPHRVKWTMLILTFEKPLAVPNLRVLFEGGNLPFEIKGSNPRNAVILIEGAIADKIVDIEAY